MDWRDGTRELTLHVIPITASPRRFNVRLAGSTTTHTVTLGGDEVKVRVKL